MSKLLRPVLQLVVGGIVLLAAVIWLSGGFGEQIGPDDRPPATGSPVASGDTVSVQEVWATVYEQASGTIASARHTTISSKILARIDEILVRAGSEVARDDVVVRLDGRDLEARLRAMREGVTAARAALQLAGSERERVDKLFASDVATRQQVDRVRAQFQVATAELERARQRLKDAQVGLSHAEIRSPVAGRVVDRLAEPGDTAAPGAPLLRIYDPGALQLEAPVRESLATRLAPGQLLRVEVPAIEASLMGEIGEIVPHAEPGARTFLVKVRLPEEARLYAGMFGRVEVPAGEGSRLSVDERAVERIGQLEYVSVVGEDGSVERRLVTTGVSLGGGRVEVLSGLAVGERAALPSSRTQGSPSAVRISEGS
jgi:membrane fusion protein (multidrug efflux system)